MSPVTKRSFLSTKSETYNYATTNSRGISEINEYPSFRRVEIGRQAQQDVKQRPKRSKVLWETGHDADRPDINDDSQGHEILHKSISRDSFFRPFGEEILAPVQNDELLNHVFTYDVGDVETEQTFPPGVQQSFDRRAARIFEDMGHLLTSKSYRHLGYAQWDLADAMLTAIPQIYPKTLGHYGYDGMVSNFAKWYDCRQEVARRYQDIMDMTEGFDLLHCPHLDSMTFTRALRRLRRAIDSAISATATRFTKEEEPLLSEADVGHLQSVKNLPHLLDHHQILTVDRACLRKRQVANEHTTKQRARTCARLRNLASLSKKLGQVTTERTIAKPPSIMSDSVAISQNETTSAYEASGVPNGRLYSRNTASSNVMRRRSLSKETAFQLAMDFESRFAIEASVGVGRSILKIKQGHVNPSPPSIEIATASGRQESTRLLDREDRETMHEMIHERGLRAFGAVATDALAISPSTLQRFGKTLRRSKTFLWHKVPAHFYEKSNRPRHESHSDSFPLPRTGLLSRHYNLRNRQLNRLQRHPELGPRLKKHSKSKAKHSQRASRRHCLTYDAPKAWKSSAEHPLIPASQQKESYHSRSLGRIIESKEHRSRPMEDSDTIQGFQDLPIVVSDNLLVFHKRGRRRKQQTLCFVRQDSCKTTFHNPTTIMPKSIVRSYADTVKIGTKLRDFSSMTVSQPDMQKVQGMHTRELAEEPKKRVKQREKRRKNRADKALKKRLDAESPCIVVSFPPHGSLGGI